MDSTGDSSSWTERSALGRYLTALQPYAPTVLRLMVGLTFMLHGLPKFQNIAGTMGFFATLGIPLPEVMAPIVAGVEFFGGLALILGLGVRVAALLLAINMVFTILLVKSRIGFIAPAEAGAGAELDALLLAGALALFILGAGALSVERNVLRREL